MILFKWNSIVVFILIEYLQQVTSQCSSPFTGMNFCFYSDQISLTWSDGYNQCLNEPISGNYMEIHSKEQFEELKNLRLNGLFWLGTNNFASFIDSQWHWLDGSIVEKSLDLWCENSTYETAIGTHCAAYDSTLNCITNYPCNSLLHALCVPGRQGKAGLTSRAVTSTGVCTNSYGGAYANWWTYSMLLLNWFVLFCFVPYVINRFNLSKILVVIIIAMMILSFIFVIIFAVLWGVQYENILQIPIVVVVFGSVASLVLLIVILILVSNRTRVQRWKACTILTIIIVIIETLLMLGLILCITHCSGYISLTSTVIDKDVIAALLASIVAAISVMFYNTLNHLLGTVGQDRVHASAPVPFNNRPQQNGNEAQYGKIERATSPVDQRIINEFYSDQPKNMHQYQLEGRQYVVYEGNSFSDVEPYRRDLTQAMLSQEPQNLEEAIARVKTSPHTSTLAHEIRQAENLLNQLRR